jgi:hypothetical protein
MRAAGEYRAGSTEAVIAGSAAVFTHLDQPAG